MITSSKKEFREADIEDLYHIDLPKGFVIEVSGSHQGLGFVIDGEKAQLHYGTSEIQRRCVEIAKIVRSALIAGGYNIDTIDPICAGDTPEPFTGTNIKENEKIIYYERPPWLESEIRQHDSQLAALKVAFTDIAKSRTLQDICEEPMVRLSEIETIRRSRGASGR